MRISDWSSDVCSSDLQVDQHRNVAAAAIGQHGIFEQYRRAALGQQAGLDFGHLQRGRHWLGYPYRSEEHTSELQSLMRISYAVFCLKKKKNNNNNNR